MLGLAIIYTHQIFGLLTIHQSLAILQSSFYGQMLVIVADYMIAMKYLHSSITLTTQIDPTKFRLVATFFAVALICFILGFGIYFGIEMESFVRQNPQVKDYIDIFCLIVEK